MQRLEKLIPLIVAIISAAALLSGYMYQKQKEKEAEIRKTRQEIYSRLVTCITERMTLFDRIEESPEYKAAKTKEEQDEIFYKDPALKRSVREQKEIATLLYLYGTDDAIKAYVNWIKGSYDPNSRKNLGKLILELRTSIYPDTKATADDANIAIWNRINEQLTN